MAEQGDADAQYELGLCYFRGDKVHRDMSEAVRLYRLAAEQGHEEAEITLEEYDEEDDEEEEVDDEEDEE